MITINHCDWYTFPLAPAQSPYAQHKNIILLPKQIRLMLLMVIGKLIEDSFYVVFFCFLIFFCHPSWLVSPHLEDVGRNSMTIFLSKTL